MARNVQVQVWVSARVWTRGYPVGGGAAHCLTLLHIAFCHACGWGTPPQRFFFFFAGPCSLLSHSAAAGHHAPLVRLTPLKGSVSVHLLTMEWVSVGVGGEVGVAWAGVAAAL